MSVHAFRPDPRSPANCLECWLERRFHVPDGVPACDRYAAVLRLLAHGWLTVDADVSAYLLDAASWIEEAATLAQREGYCFGGSRPVAVVARRQGGWWRGRFGGR